MISFVAFSLRRAWQGFWRNAVMSLAATATMVFMLVLLSGFFVVLTGLNAGLEFVEQKVQIVADVKDSATTPAIEALTARTAALPEVASVEYVSSGEALRRFQERLRQQGREDLTKCARQEPVAGLDRGQAQGPQGVRERRRVPPGRPVDRAGQGGPEPRRPGPDGDEPAPDGWPRRPRPRRGRRPVHHRQHDPARGRRPGRGDRDHAPRRRLGRVHPLAVHLRGRARRADRRRW